MNSLLGSILSHFHREGFYLLWPSWTENILKYKFSYLPNLRAISFLPSHLYNLAILPFWRQLENSVFDPEVTRTALAQITNVLNTTKLKKKNRPFFKVLSTYRHPKLLDHLISFHFPCTFWCLQVQICTFFWHYIHYH